MGISGSTDLSAQTPNFMDECSLKADNIKQDLMTKIQIEIAKDIENPQRIKDKIAAAMARNRNSIIYIANTLCRGESSIIYCRQLDYEDMENLMSESVCKQMQDKLGNEFRIVYRAGITKKENDWDQYNIEWGNCECAII